MKPIERSPMEGKEDYKCPLCSHTFDLGKLECKTCPMSKGCKMICCPNCGYQWVEESRAVNWIKRLIGKVRGIA